MAVDPRIDQRTEGLPGGIILPAYNAVYDPKTMGQMQGYENMLAMNSGGYNKFRDLALSKGPSAYANAASRRQNLLAMQGKENLASGTQGQNALAMSNLAAQGGLSSGARERVAETGQNAYAMGSQDLARGNAMANLQIGSEDQAQKLNALGALPGMEQSRVSGWNEVRGRDLANEMGETGRINEYNRSRAETINTAIANAAQAQATLDAKPDGFFGGRNSFFNNPFGRSRNRSNSASSVTSPSSTPSVTPSTISGSGSGGVTIAPQQTSVGFGGGAGEVSPAPRAGYHGGVPDGSTYSLYNANGTPKQRSIG